MSKNSISSPERTNIHAFPQSTNQDPNPLRSLVEKCGLLELLNINLRDDPQKDYGCLESTAILIGALSELCGSFYREEAESQKMIWLKRGKGVLGNKVN